MHSVQRLRNELGNRKIVILFQAEARNFCLLHNSRTDVGSTQPPIQCVTGELSVGVKHNGYETYHTPPSSGEFKNEWSYITDSNTLSWRVQRRLKFYSAY